MVCRAGILRRSSWFRNVFATRTWYNFPRPGKIWRPWAENSLPTKAFLSFVFELDKPRLNKVNKRGVSTSHMQLNREFLLVTNGRYMSLSRVRRIAQAKNGCPPMQQLSGSSECSFNISKINFTAEFTAYRFIIRITRAATLTRSINGCLRVRALRL